MPHPQHITILLAPAAAGKTEAALAELAMPRRGRAILLMPSGLHRDRLLARVRGRIRRAQVLQFGRLVDYMLKRAGVTLPAAGAALRSRLLRAELRRLAAAGRLPLLGPVAHKAGLAAEVLGLIDELQGAEVAPAALAGAGVGPYDGELAAIYAAYGQALARLGVSDEAGRMAAAIGALQAGGALLIDLELLVVDGFDQFTPLQLRLLRELCGRAGRCLITLTGGEGGPRPAHRRFAATLAVLRAALPGAAIERLARGPSPAPALAHLEADLFELDAAPPAPAGGAVRLIGAPDREREVRAALRHVRDLLGGGAAPEDVAVLFRDAAPYAPLLREVGAEYGLPLAIAAGRPLAEAPPVISLLAMLGLPAASYPRRALVECWQALGERGPALVGAELPGITSFAAAAAMLDRAARGGGYTAGLDRLRALLQALAAAPPPAEDQGGPAIAPDQAARLLALLDAFVAWLAPPESATVSGYVEWTQERLEPLPFTPAQADRLRRAVEELADASLALGEAPQPFAAFLGDLEAAVGAAHYDRQSPRAGAVAALDVLAARGACFRHVVLVGLAEGEFPAPMPAPTFYTRSERAALAEAGITLPAPDPADERSIFYEAATRARETLTLCYTRLDEAGNPLKPSPYLRDLLARLAAGSVPERTIRAGSAPGLGEAASPQERLIALMDAGLPAGGSDGVPPELLAHVARACAVERAREGLAPHGPYEGALDELSVIAALAERFGPHHRWSVTQINDYTTCPFRFAAAHLLRLEPPDEPEEGMAQAGRGRLLHAILAEAGRRWSARGLPAAAEHEGVYLADLAATADELLAAAPQDYGFEPGPLWAWERADLRDTLARAISLSLRDAAGGQFTPAGTERSFGMGQGSRPLRVETDAGPALVAGRIDRIDAGADGSLSLIDYKSGRSLPSLPETLSGHDVQLTVYTLAAEQLLAPGQGVARASYLALGSGKSGKSLTPAEREQAEAALRARLGEAVAGARAGQFPVRPRECPPSCNYMGICRRNLAKRDVMEGEL